MVCAFSDVMGCLQIFGLFCALSWCILLWLFFVGRVDGVLWGFGVVGMVGRFLSFARSLV